MSAPVSRTRTLDRGSSDAVRLPTSETVILRQDVQRRPPVLNAARQVEGNDNISVKAVAKLFLAAGADLECKLDRRDSAVKPRFARPKSVITGKIQCLETSTSLTKTASGASAGSTR
jgi:hypothetical protein